MRAQLKCFENVRIRLVVVRSGAVPLVSST